LQKERRDRQQEEHRQRRDLRQKNRLDQPPQRVRP
jgi:hypothetical protein